MSVDKELVLRMARALSAAEGHEREADKAFGVGRMAGLQEARDIIAGAPDSLDAAWAAAEAALPKGWLMVQARRMRVGAALRRVVWWAEAVAAKSDMGPGVRPAQERAEDENLPAALRALAAKLREVPR